MLIQIPSPPLSPEIIVFFSISGALPHIEPHKGKNALAMLRRQLLTFLSKQQEEQARPDYSMNVQSIRWASERQVYRMGSSLRAEQLNPVSLMPDGLVIIR